MAQRASPGHTGIAAAFVAAGAALGLSAESSFYGLGAPGEWVPDALAGWALLAAAVVVGRRAWRVGLLFGAAGTLWFAGNFAGPLAFLYIGALGQLALTYPTGEVHDRVAVSALVALYGLAFVPLVWQTPEAMIGIALGLVAASSFRYFGARGNRRRLRQAGWQATAALAGILMVVGSLHLAGARAPALLVEQLAIAGYAAALAAGLRGQPWLPRGMADLMARLADEEIGPVRMQLARALGDPRLEVGYWDSERGRYIDEGGRELAPTSSAERQVTELQLGEGRVVIVHEPGAMDDPAIADAIAAATHLVRDYAQLQAEILSRQAEIRASRLRLIHAADEERAELDRALHQGPERRLRRVAATLSNAAPARSAADVEVVRTRIAQTLEELQRLAAGLHPRELAEAGLGPALGSLAANAPLPVRVHAETDRVPGPIEMTLYFVAAEAIANAVKHAAATNASVELVVRDGTVRLVVADDGVGGATMSGSGLRGLADRLEVFGGTLAVVSPPGQGTRVVAAIPMAGARSASRADATPTPT